MLGFTTGTGLAYTESNGNRVSESLMKIGGWISDVFKNEGSSSGPQVQSEPIDPITPITQVWGKIFTATQTVVGFVPEGYTWISNNENSKWLLGFFKSFLGFSFAKDVVFNFHLTVRAWLGVLADKAILSKFPDAINKFQALAKFLSKNESQTSQDVGKEMINWLYLRFFVNPRRTVNVLARGQKSNSQEGEQGLKCNGKKRKKQTEENLPLGICFIAKEGNKLIDHMTNFLKEGTIPPTKAQEK